MKLVIVMTVIALSVTGCSTGYRARISLAWQALTFQVDAESPPIGTTNNVPR